MTHVSRRKLDPETLKTLHEGVVSVLSKNSPAETGALLSVLLTKTEKIMVAKRLGMLLMLGQEAPENRVAEALKVTPLTVMRTKMRMLEGNPQTYKLFFKKLRRWENLSMLKDALSRLGKMALKKLVRGAGGRP